MVAFLAPVLGAFGGTQALSTLAGGYAGKQFLGGLHGLLSNLFGGSQQAGGGSGSDQTNALLGDIKDMLSQLLEQDGDCNKSGGKGCGGSDGHMNGGCGDDKMKGGRGDDHMNGRYGNDRMYGGRGDDHMYGGCGDDKMKGGRGDDHMYGGCGDDKMKGGRGDDYLYGGAGHNRLFGGRGDDTYVIASGSDNVIRDGRGSDTVKLDGNRDEYTMERDGDDLILTHKEDGTRVVIKDQYAGKGVDSLKFDDGTFDDFDSVGEEDCGCEPTPPPCDPGCGDVAPMPYPMLHAYEGGGDQGGRDGGDGPGDGCDGPDSGGSDGCSI
jgi:Ca2+-binding RTX toxin-like protein